MSVCVHSEQAPEWWRGTHLLTYGLLLNPPKILWQVQHYDLEDNDGLLCTAFMTRDRVKISSVLFVCVVGGVYLRQGPVRLLQRAPRHLQTPDELEGVGHLSARVTKGRSL